MKNTKVTLVPLTMDDREQFILDNQWAFKYGALQEFGERDNHIDDDGEIISRKTIERCIDAPNNETYRIVLCKNGFYLSFRNCVPHRRLCLNCGYVQDTMCPRSFPANSSYNARLYPDILLSHKPVICECIFL